jgi:nuclear GTP-binding protein
MGKATIQITKGKGKAIAEDVNMEAEEDTPMLINRDLPNLQAALDQADVILQVLDARDPLSFRSSHLEELAITKPGRRLLFILNKIGSFVVSSQDILH